MHEHMKMGGHPWGYTSGIHGMDVPLIPAPVAFCALLIGVMIGVMIGKKKSMMHHMGPGMMHGMGSGAMCGPKPGMMEGMGSDMGGSGDWSMRKKMMKKMWAHHHHGEGTPACRCDEADAAMATPGEGMPTE